MDSPETNRLASLFRKMEMQVNDMAKQISGINSLLKGTHRTVVQTPSGFPGVNKQWMVPAVTLGDVPVDEIAPDHPFEVLDASNETDGIQVYVRPGMISSSLGYADAPTGMVLDDSDPADKFYLAISATGRVYLRAEIAEDENRVPSVDDFSLIYSTTTPTNSATVEHVCIAAVTVESGAITSIFQNINTNLLHSVYFEPYSVPDYWRQMIGPISAYHSQG